MNKKQRRLKKKRQRRHETQFTPRIETSVQASRPVHQMPLWTRTGELYQPIRITYTVPKPLKVFTAFQHLQCMEQLTSPSQWKWLYIAEAATIMFEKQPRNLVKPIVLGTFSFKETNRLTLEVHSIERALEAMVFFSTRLPRGAAKITHVSIANRLFDPHEAQTFTLEECDERAVQPEDPILSVLHQIDALPTRGRQALERSARIEALLKANATIAFPEVEHIAIQYSKRKLSQISFLLSSRQYIAIQHWKGNTRYSLSAYLRDILEETNGRALPSKKLITARLHSTKQFAR